MPKSPDEYLREFVEADQAVIDWMQAADGRGEILDSEIPELEQLEARRDEALTAARRALQDPTIA
jgi:hypothetical protein